jgi:hypothetical protein
MGGFQWMAHYCLLDSMSHKRLFTFCLLGENTLRGGHFGHFYDMYVMYFFAKRVTINFGFHFWYLG